MTWSMVQWFSVPWAGDEGALTGRLHLAVPTAEAGLLGVEAGTDMPLKAALAGMGWALRWK